MPNKDDPSIVIPKIVPEVFQCSSTDDMKVGDKVLVERWPGDNQWRVVVKIVDKTSFQALPAKE